MKDQIAHTLTRKDVTALILAARKARGLSLGGSPNASACRRSSRIRPAWA